MTVRPALLALLLLPSIAHADLGGKRGGFWGDVGGGLAVAELPWSAGGGWTVALGGWFGKYDDSFAIGRRWDFGVRAVQQYVAPNDRTSATLRTAPMVEVRRSIDLLVVGLRVGGSVGALVVTDLAGSLDVGIGATVRANGAVGWRFVPRSALVLRLDAGIDVLGSKVAPVLDLTVGLEVTLPGRRRAATPSGG